MSLIRLEHLTKIYKSKENVAIGIQDINVEFDQGEFVAIIGSSGSGKTTLLNVISGMDSYEEGDLYIANKSTSDYTLEDFENYRRANVAFIFQNYQLIDSYSVLENVMVELIFKGFSRKNAKIRAKEILEKVGLSHRLRNRATKLSGGEKQRVVIARAIASNAKILVCDEPTGNLDSKNSLEIMKLLKEISVDKLVLFVTHDESLIEGNATRIIKIKDGRLESDIRLDNSCVKNEDLVIEKAKPNKVTTQLYIALKNILRTPKKSIFITIVFMVLCFVLMTSVAYFPTTIESYDTITTEYKTFENRDDNRIVVYGEYKNEFEGRNDINVLENDYMLDVTYRIAVYDSNLSKQIQPRSYIKASMDHLYLLAGKIPTEIDEILLIVSDDYSEQFYKDVLNTYAKISFPAETIYMPTRYKIVGFASYTSEYITNAGYKKPSSNSETTEADLLYTSTDFYMSNVGMSAFFEDVLQKNMKHISKSINDDFSLFVNGKHNNVTLYEGRTETIKVCYKYKEMEYKLLLGGKEIDLSNYPIEYVFTYNSGFNIGIGANFLTSMLSGNVYRYSVYAADELIDEIYEKLYADNSLIVYKMRDLRLRTDLYNIDGIIDNVLYLVFLFVEILISLFISILITSFVLGSKKKELGVLRVIGLSEKDVLKILLFELMFLMLISITLCMSLSLLTIIFDFGFKLSYLFDSIEKLIVSIIILLVMTFFIALSWNKKMFRKSAREVLKVGDSL